MRLVYFIILSFCFFVNSVFASGGGSWNGNGGDFNGGGAGGSWGETEDKKPKLTSGRCNVRDGYGKTAQEACQNADEMTWAYGEGNPHGFVMNSVKKSHETSSAVYYVCEYVTSDFINTAVRDTVTCTKEKDKPDIDKPDTDKPDTDKPDTDKPDIDKSDIDKPDTDKPDTDKPEINQTLINQTLINQTLINQTLINQTLINQTLINQIL